jgi:hypothetical protein
MSITATVTTSISGGISASGTKTYTGDERVTQSFTVADSATDEQRTLNIDVTEMQMVYIVSDQDITMEWNDTIGSQGSIALKANVAFLEVVAADQYHAAKLAVDVTDLYFTNSSGSTANISIGVIQNNTP